VGRRFALTTGIAALLAGTAVLALIIWVDRALAATVNARK
jgi:hypothetical protein